MKFELRSAYSSYQCTASHTVNGRRENHDLHFKDIKSVKSYKEIKEYENFYGDKQVHDIWYVEINTLEELMALQEEVGCELVVGDDEIVIYDGYLE